MKRPRGPFTVRLPVAMIARLEAIAREQGISESAAARIALQRGMAAMEFEVDLACSPLTEPPPPPPTGMRRRILSHGIR